MDQVIDNMLKTMFVAAALVLVLGGFARAESEALREAQEIVDRMEAHKRQEAADAQRWNYNPPSGSYYAPVESTLQNWEFNNQSYRK